MSYNEIFRNQSFFITFTERDAFLCQSQSVKMTLQVGEVWFKQKASAGPSLTVEAARPQ